MSSRLFSLFCLAATVIGDCGVVYSQPDGTARVVRVDVVNEVRQALLDFDDLEMKAVIRTTFPADDSGETGGLSTTHILLRQQNGRKLLSRKSVVERPGANPQRLQSDFVVADNGQVFVWQATINSSLQQEQGDDRNLGVVLHSQDLAGSQRLDRRSIDFALNDGGCAFFVIGYSPLLEYLNTSAELIVTNDERGFLISGSGRFGDFKLVVAEENGWLPLTFEIAKARHQETIGGLVSDVYQDAVDAVIWTGNVHDFHRGPRGRLSPSRISVQRETRWSEKGSEFINTEIEIESVDFEPEFSVADFETDIVLPRGFKVSVAGAPHLPYMWDGQAAVPGVPDLPARTRKIAYEDIAAPRRGWGSTLPLLIGVNIVMGLILAVVAWKMARR